MAESGVLTDLDMMRLHADVLFTYDARGRMLLTNEPREDARRPAPLVYVGRTSDGDGHLIRTGSEMPDALSLHMDVLAGLRRDPVPAVRKIVMEHAPDAMEHGSPAYRFPESIQAPTEAVRLTNENRELVRDTFRWLHDEIDDWQPLRRACSPCRTSAARGMPRPSRLHGPQP